MSRLSRYILKELLKVFLITLAGMTVLMMFVGIAQEAVRQGLGPLPILQLVPYALPNALRFAVPGTILFAACSVYGRIAGDNEVVAVKSMGISPLAVIKPALAVAFIISLVAVWLNDVAVSWGRSGVNRVVMQSIEEIVYGMLRTQRSYSTDRFAINVVEVQDRKLIRPTLTFYATADAEAFTLSASEAELKYDELSDALTVVMIDCEANIQDNVYFRLPGKTQHEIPLSIASRKGDNSIGPSHYPLRSIPTQIIKQERRIERLGQDMAAEAGYLMLTGRFDELLDRGWQTKLNRLEETQVRMFKLRTAPWRRWANGFSCFFFVLVGVPLAICLRNSDIWTTFGLCFLPILIVYYPLLAVGVDGAKAGQLPTYSVWLGNVVMCLVGCHLLRRVVRH